METRQLLRARAHSIAGVVVVAVLTVAAGAVALGQDATTSAPIVPATPGGGDVEYVEVLHLQRGRPRECPAIDDSRRPVQDGCRMRLSTRARLRVLTPFGPVHFKDCELRFTAHIAFNGAVVLADQSTSDVPRGPICGDVRACEEETDVDRKPWMGRIARDRSGRAHLVVDLCLDLSLGWFRGPFEITLLPGRNDWRFVADRALVGSSGLEITGTWHVRRHDLRIRPSGS